MQDTEQTKLEETGKHSGVPLEFVETAVRTRQAQTMREKLEGFNEERTLIEQGNPEAIKAQHEKGRLTARERVNRLVDRGSFEELDLWRRPYETGYPGEGAGQGDGLVAGYGSIDERPVTICAQDATVMDGTVGTVHARKATMIMENALNARTPMITIFVFV